MENKAIQLLRKYDPLRLEKRRPWDVYDVIEKCLDVPYDWKYITPDQSILGLTSFCTGTIWVWPEPYFNADTKPYKILLQKGTILIDSTLTEGNNHGRENFTVIHEVFHQILHKPYFQNFDVCLGSQSKELSILNTSYYITAAIPEQQANYCAAAFLMPAELITRILKQYYRLNNYLDFRNSYDRKILLELAQAFGVTKTAMKYRLMNLGLAYQEYWF